MNVQTFVSAKEPQTRFRKEVPATRLFGVVLKLILASEERTKGSVKTEGSLSESLLLWKKFLSRQLLCWIFCNASQQTHSRLSE